MPNWVGYVVGVLVILVLIAPKQTLGPVFGAVGRYTSVGVVALFSLGTGSYALGVAVTGRDRLIGFGGLGLGGLCAAWWLYRLFVPAYRDQVSDSAPMVDDR